jgi:hypothetical protein
MMTETGLERFGSFCGRTQCGFRQQKRAGVKPMRRISLATAWPSTPGIWMSSITTSGRLQQLLGNLALNEIKYGAPDAPVRVVVTCQGPWGVRSRRGPTRQEPYSLCACRAVSSAHADRPSACFGGRTLAIADQEREDNTVHDHARSLCASFVSSALLPDVRFSRLCQVVDYGK